MLTEAHRERFERDGFVVVEDIIADESLNAVEKAFSARLDELAEYLDVSLPPDLATINEKMLGLEELHPGACLVFTHSHIPSPALLSLWSEGPLLELAADLLGPDVDGHPFLAVRPKPPGVSLFTVPWHQDSAYLEDGAQGTPQITVWVPLMDATRDNGCMEFAKGAHKQRRELLHVSQNYMEYGNAAWYLEIPPSETSSFDVVECEVKRGSCIVFGHLAPHRSLPNLSSTCRWSIDFRYLAAGGFAGTQQPAVPFMRERVSEASNAEELKRAYISRQAGRDRTMWRHRVENAVWKERWVQPVGGK